MSSNNEKVKEFYSNDIVYRFDKHKKIIFGMVTDSFEVSSDIDDYGALQKGQIRVLWSTSSREQVWRQSKVRLMNRSIIPGDIVRRLERGKETQRGYCKETRQVATVQIIGTDKVIEHVAAERLHGVRPFEVDDVVCLGNKFGRIEAIDQMVTMQSKDGSIVEFLTSINHDDLDDYWLSKRNRICIDSYYAGQEVVCIPSNLEQPNWIKKTKAMKRNMQNRQRFTIQHVEDVLVEMACSSSKMLGLITEIPPEDIKKLKLLDHPSDNCLELVERRLLKLSSNDVLIKKKDWIRKLSLMYRPDVPKVRHIVSCNSKTGPTRMPKIRSSGLLYPPQSPPILHNTPPTAPEEDEDDDWWTEEGEEEEEPESTEGYCTETSSPSSVPPGRTKRHFPPRPREVAAGHTLPVEVICVESKVTVVWQDNTEERDIPSTQLYYSVSLDDHEFFPGEWVVADGGGGGALEGGEWGKYGVVQWVDCIERTAKIKWFVYSENDKRPQELYVNETSVYDLKKHPKFVYRPGSIVQWKPAEDEKVGKVIDSCPEGYVKVQWLDGTTAQCWPQQLEAVPDMPEYDLSEDTDASKDSDDGQMSWETESIESYAGDLTDETALQNVAARLDFVRSRIVYLKEAFRQHTITENFTILKDLLLVYDNSSYLDKLLGTSFFSLKSKHFQALLMQAKEKAKTQSIELRGRLFSTDNLCPSISKIKVAEKENINKMIKLENRINAQIEKRDSNKDPGVPTTPLTPDSSESSSVVSQENLCVELLSMLKVRMDLAYAEIISRIGGSQAFSVITKATENILPTPSNSTPLPSVPATPEDSFSTLSPLKAFKTATENASALNAAMITPDVEPYCSIEEAPTAHHYYGAKFEPTDLQRYLKAVQKEYKLLRESLPSGVWVRSYGNRMDLLSVMIRGPAKTPYEDGIFLFDIQLSPDYPRSPPLVHYISYSSERLNPNLYVEGKVCVSLLGTWSGRGTEVWGPNSTLLQLIVSIQGLILVSEPYYNEAGYEKQTDTQQGCENSRTYNELVILKLVQSMRELILSPPEVFKKEVTQHFRENGQKMCQRLEKFCSGEVTPDFPLLPVSKGLKLSLNSAMEAFKKVLAEKVLLTSDNVV